jgi:hypothetical protein
MIDYLETTKLVSKRLGESASSCALIMTQGDVSGLSLAHWSVALQTGLIATLATLAVVIYGKSEWLENKYAMAGAIGFFTAVADMFVHPSGFGGASTEAIVTGIGAGILCLLMSKVYK